MERLELQFRDLYERHYSKLCYAAFRILKDKDAAREVVQEVFTEFWNRNDWHQLESPQGYLYVSVYNRALNSLKRGRRFASEELIPEGDMVAMEDMLENAELQQLIVAGIEKLPERCRLIFVLSREEELTYAEIATHLDLSVKTVEHQMGIALKRLRKHLSAYLK